MSQEYLNRNQQQNNNSNTGSSQQKKIDPEKQQEWLNNQQIDSGWSVFDLEPPKLPSKEYEDEYEKEKTEEFHYPWDRASKSAERDANKKADTTLGLKDSVGVNCINDPNDIALVESKLIMNGFLNMIQIGQESLFDAIGKFQSEILGIKPDKIISAGGMTERALATYYTNPVAKWKYSDFERNLDDTFSLDTEKANSSFTETMKGVTINSETNASNVNLKALLALQTRLEQFGYSFKKVKLNSILSTKKDQYTKDQKKVLSELIQETYKALVSFQTKLKIDEKCDKILPNIKVGEIKEGDDTFIYLRDFKSHTFSWFTETGEIKKVKADNLKDTKYTVNKEGLGIIGSISPNDSSLEDFKNSAGIDESRAKALKAASVHEGNFDGINTYDVAKISYGFIQFAGGNRSLEYLLATIKSEKPDIFKSLFTKNGIDVEYRTNKNDHILNNTCRIVLHDPVTKKTYRGLEAEDKISQTPIYAGVFMKASENKDVRDVQIKLAKELYMDRSENSKLRLNIKILTVSKEGINGPKKFYGEDIKAYEQTEEFKTNEKNKHILYKQLNLSNLKLSDILQSEKELAALYGTYINNPSQSLAAFRNGILQIIKDKGLTNEEEVNNINPIELLKVVKTKALVKDENGKNVANKIHQKRIQDAIDSKELN